MADDDKVIGYTDEGLVLYTYNEILNQLIDGFNEIYGSDLSDDSSTPDMQLIRILAQMLSDEHDTVRELDNSFNPDIARGVAQDYRYRLNNIIREAGSYTSVPVSFTVTSTVTLQGLNGQEPSEGYAWGCTDGTYNYLLDGTEEFTPGTYTRYLTCSQMAAVNPPIDSITEQIQDYYTIYVTNITNSAAISIGSSQESDEHFAARRESCFVQSGMNCCDSIVRQLLLLPTVNNAKAYEHDYSNYPDGTDSDGIPLNTIWVIVDGGSADEIGRAIYENISGTDTKGDQTTTVTSDSGQQLTFKFDYAVTQNIYLKFVIKKMYDSVNLQQDGLKETIANNTSIDIDAAIDSSTMNEIIRDAIAENTESVQLLAVPLSIELSVDGIEWVEYLPGMGRNIKYVLLADNIQFTIE